MNLSIALLQLMPVENDLQANLVKGEAACRQARQMGADLALFPEMWSIGYPNVQYQDPQAVAAFQSLAITEQDVFVRHFCGLARELEMAIVLTYLQRWGDGVRNTATLIDRHGEIRMMYAKVHTCEWDTESILTPGDAFPVTALDTAAGEVNVGIMICFDREFPESARLLMLGGAEVILTPNACEIELNRKAQFRARAYENMTTMVLTNYPAPKENGHSVVYDGVCFTDQGSRDSLVLEAGEQEGVYLAQIDLERLRVYRAREVWGDAYRHPRHYGRLVSDVVDEPFRRKDASR
ncbi:MAG TPA: carbon-nitrogen hydrolase family protein [Anaerolineaceae bacterium]